jgi:outer membrane protein
MMAATAVVAAGAASAQTKVAVVNMQQAILGTAEIKKASADLGAKFKPRQAEIEKLRTELEGIQQKLQAGQGKLTPLAENDLRLDGQRKQRNLQRMSQDLQEEVDSARNDILSAAGRRMSEVIRKLAEERDLDVVVDTSSTLFYKPALNVTPDAIAAYDKTYPPK